MEISWRLDRHCDRLRGPEFATGTLTLSVPDVFVRSADLIASFNRLCNPDEIANGTAMEQECIAHRDVVKKVLEDATSAPADASSPEHHLRSRVTCHCLRSPAETHTCKPKILIIL